MVQPDISIFDDINTAVSTNGLFSLMDTAFLPETIMSTDDDINYGQTTAERLSGAIGQSQLAYVLDATLYENQVNQSVDGVPMSIDLIPDENYFREAKDQEKSIATDEASINSKILTVGMPITLQIL